MVYLRADIDNAHNTHANSSGIKKIAPLPMQAQGRKASARPRELTGPRGLLFTCHWGFRKTGRSG